MISGECEGRLDEGYLRYLAEAFHMVEPKETDPQLLVGVIALTVSIVHA